MSTRRPFSKYPYSALTHGISTTRSYSAANRAPKPCDEGRQVTPTGQTRLAAVRWTLAVSNDSRKEVAAISNGPDY